MREILFRGKRLDNGEWVEGAFLNDRDGAFYICPAVSDISYGDGGNRRRIGCWYKVDPSTVGQYTGLKDKNGKRIFEGDIIKWDYAYNEGKSYQVIYDVGGACFSASRKHNGDNTSTIFYNDEQYAEDIGNIYDNPELLERGE